MRRKLVSSLETGGPEWAWGMPRKEFPKKKSVLPLTWTQETELTTNFKVLFFSKCFISSYYFF